MEQTSALLEAKWTLDVDRMGLEKKFEFASYAKALVSRFSCLMVLLYLIEWMADDRVLITGFYIAYGGGK